MMTKKVLLIIVLLFMLSPWIEQEFNLVPVKSMGGAFAKTTSIPFSVESWLDGVFQTTQEKYLNENFGFRNTLVRLNNQVAFTAFNYARAIDVVVGKENYLYGDSYIKAYYGNDFLGYPRIKDKIKKLEFLHHVLKKKNIDLMVVFVPGKASFFPEFLPEGPGPEKRITNYSVYKEELGKSEVPFIDLCSYFISQKYKSPYPLFPKTGIHWSVYASELGADSISSYIGKLRGGDSPRIHIKGVEMPDTTRGTDADIEEGMNLLFKIPKFKMAYPKVDVDMENKIRPRELTIGDSYYWGIYGSGRASQLFTKPHFWYYFNELYVPEQIAPLTNKDVDLKKEIEQQEVIMLFANDSRALDMGFGFIEDAYKLYSGEIDIREETIKRKIADMKATKEWYEMLQKTAAEKHISIDTVLRDNAIYLFDMENAKKQK